MKGLMKLVWAVTILLWLSVPWFWELLMKAVGVVVLLAAMLSPLFLWAMLRTPSWLKQQQEEETERGRQGSRAAPVGSPGPNLLADAGTDFGGADAPRDPHPGAQQSGNGCRRERAGMQEARFKVWLSGKRELNARSVGSRISNCRRVEHYEGDLDAHYDADGLASLMDRLNSRGPKHRIPINGDIYNGTATLKSAVGLYRDFCRTVGSTGAPAKRRTKERQTRRPGAHWPVWPQPNDEDSWPMRDLRRRYGPVASKTAALRAGLEARNLGAHAGNPGSRAACRGRRISVALGGRTARLPTALQPPPHLLTTLPAPAGGGRRGRPRPARRRPWSSNSPRRSRGGGDELGGRGQLRRREVHERLDAAVRSALRTRPRREQVRKGLRRPVRSSSQSSSSLLGVSGSWSPTCIAGICGRSPARRRAGAASRRTGERRTATTGGRRSGFRRCRE